MYTYEVMSIFALAYVRDVLEGEEVVEKYCILFLLFEFICFKKFSLSMSLLYLSFTLVIPFAFLNKSLDYL